MNILLVIEKRKHIMLLSSWYPNRLNPFNGDFVQRHAMAISLLNQVSVIHAEGDPALNHWQCTVQKINDQLTEYLYYFPKSRWSVVNFIQKMRGIAKGMRQIGSIDLIHANVVHYHFIFLIFQSIPYIITEHATQYHRLNTLPNAWLKKIVYKPIFRQAKAVLTVSMHLGRKLENLFGPLAFQVIPNVVNTTIFYPMKKHNEPFTFLHISNLSPVKNISGILEASLNLKKQGFIFKFFLGGNGDTQGIDEFRKKENMESTLEILPSLTHEEVADQMRRADCFILFSDFENQPCVLAEAMASGLPFISTRVGGVEEFIVDNSCMIIERGNINQLVEAMAAMIQGRICPNQDELVEYAKSNFSPVPISQKINKIYNECLNMI